MTSVLKLEEIADYGIVNRLLFENHDLQVRFRWGRNDVAIWDKYEHAETATF